MRRLIAFLSGLALAGFGLVTISGPAHATSGNPQAGPFPVGNLLSYANSDFEGSANFIPVTNATISDSTTTAFLHHDSLRDVASSAGTTSFKLQEGSTATQINLTGGDTYTVSAYVKIPATAGESLTFELGNYDSSGKWIGWWHTPTLSLNSSGDWQYVEGQITEPTNAAWALDSPKITISGVTAGQASFIDELTLRPDRAALAIGAHGSACNGCEYTAQDWLNSNSTIGPLQSDKEFFSSSSPTGGKLPADFASTNCATIASSLPKSQPPPVCLLAWVTPMTQAEMSAFLSTVPAAQELYLIFQQEPEGKSFSYCGKTGGPSFVCEFNIQAGYVRSAGDYPNIFMAMDAASYQYGNVSDDSTADDETGTNGTGCSFIPSASSVDVYLFDFYENTTVDGTDVNTQALREDNWKNWQDCVLAQNRPFGLAEYGLDQCTTLNRQNTPTTLIADNSYLEALGRSVHEEVALWEYWYSDFGGTPTCTLFNNTYGAITQWQANETQNGGG